MRIFAIGRNYAEHIKELNNERPDEPVIFTKPDYGLLRKMGLFTIPIFPRIFITKWNWCSEFAKKEKIFRKSSLRKYYDALASELISLHVTCSKKQRKRIALGYCKRFQRLGAISDKFMLVIRFQGIWRISTSVSDRWRIKQQGNTSLMLFSFDYIISYLSKFFTLRTGDLIFTGTPKGVGPVKVGNVLSAYIENEKLLEFEIK